MPDGARHEDGGRGAQGSNEFGRDHGHKNGDQREDKQKCYKSRRKLHYPGG
jgi:hypothetical protein